MAMFLQREHRAIDVTHAYAEHDSGRVLLIDVRGRDERARGSAPGFQHVPLDELERRRPPDTPIAFVCQSGRRSQPAARTAREARLAASDIAARLATDRSPA